MGMGKKRESNETRWVCDPSYHRAGDTCVACRGCAANEYVDSCDKDTGAATCAPCPQIPDHALREQTSEPNMCGTWKCRAGFFQFEHRCEACDTDCPVGSFLTQCSGRDKGYCIPCSLAPKHGFHVSNGGMSDSCRFECSTGMYKNSSTCQRCKQDCPIGFFRSGCGPGESRGMCIPCPDLPQGAHYIDPGTDEYDAENQCKWEPKPDFFLPTSDSTEPLPCGDTCDVGFHMIEC